MRSSFFGFNVATQGLYSARIGLDIANHNISNAKTKGYSRQYGNFVASRPLPNAGRGMVGTGAEILSIERHRNEYLDYKYWDIMKDSGYFDTKAEALDQMELIFNEPSEAGFTKHFDELFGSLQTLAKNPADNAARTSMVNKLESFGAYINDIGEQFNQVQQEMNFGVKTTVEQINYKAAQIASLNQQITSLEVNGDHANDLRDERANLLDELSQLVSINVNVYKDQFNKETLSVDINGQELVNGSISRELEIRKRNNLSNPEDNVDMYDVYWKSGKKLYTENPLLRGKLKAYIDVRDGNNSENFKGQLVTASTGSPAVTSIVVDNVSRSDLSGVGTLVIGSERVDYTSFSYDETTGQITFTVPPTTIPLTTGAPISIGLDNSFKGVPYYKQQMNHFVRTISMEFNKIHEQGNGGTGEPLFVYAGYNGTPALDTTSQQSYHAITVENFRLNPNIADDVNQLMVKADVQAGESANDLVEAMIKLRHDTGMFKKGKPDEFIQSLISEVGIDTKEVNSFRKGQENISRLIMNQKLSVSSVDLDEETMDLIKFKHAYNVSAKVISVFDEIYNITINQMAAR